MNTFEVVIFHMDADAQGIVTHLHWRVQMSGVAIEAIFRLDPPPADPIPWSELTPEVVMSWIPAALVESAQEAIAQKLAAAQAAPSGLPWLAA